MPNILMVAYYFPPLGGAGVQRSLKFAKYLPSYGWNPSILSIQDDPGALKDTTLLDEISSGVKVYRSPALLLPKFLPWRVRSWITRWLLVIDEQIGWFFFAVRMGLTISKQDNIQVIFTSSAPYTSHLIGMMIKKKAGLPWIADFRDPWVGNFRRSYPTVFHQRFNSQLESKVIHQADVITVVSQPMKQSLMQRYSDLSDTKIQVIPNGYDASDFIRITPVNKNPNKFTIIYTGSFYAHGLTPDNFLAGLKAVIEKGLIPRDQMKVILVGNIGTLANDQINDTGLGDIVSSLGYLPHKEAISYMISSDVLLLIIGSGSGTDVIYTGKLFEYLAARKPILALVGSGEAQKLIEISHSGVIVDPDDIHSISDQIVQLFNFWKNNNLTYTGDLQIISSFDRYKLTGQLAAILKNICD